MKIGLMIMEHSAASRVIIVGAGPVGLGAALELARFGVRSVLIEKHDDTSWHPKTRVFNTRTMEIARGWGPAVYKRLRSIDAPDGWKSPIRFLSSLTGEEYGAIDTKGFAGPGPEISPALALLSSQEKVEKILLDAVRATNLVDERFGTEALRVVKGGATGDDEAVVEIKHTASGKTARLSGAALIAADGAASRIRGELGLHLEGPQGLSHIINCYFKADIERHIAHRKGCILFVSNERATGVLQPLDAVGRWLCQIGVTPEQWSLDVFTKAQAQDWIRAATGIADLEAEIVTMGLWRLNATIVERLVQGRVMFCGDAAHQFPPTGGLGVNSGVQGMHNAMWKLAYCVQGKAGWPLLETYQTERHQLTQRIVDQSLQNSINVNRIFAAAAKGGESGLSTDDVVASSRRYGNHSGVEFGAAYASPAVIGDGTSAPTVTDTYSDYIQSATPGCRAPHVWLGQPDAQLSTLDLIGPSFTLLAAPGGALWRAHAAEASRACGVPIVSYIVGEPGLDDHGTFAHAYGLTSDGAVLIRPDGHIGWRSRSAATQTALIEALHNILAH